MVRVSSGTLPEIGSLHMLNTNSLEHFKTRHPTLWSLVTILTVGFVFVAGFAITLILVGAAQSPVGAAFGTIFNWLFALNSLQALW